ncbi:hypothetical protein OHA70_02895 [Kribbella sp. NBC_00382]|uniref:hypothetical protein n=1 Tax=Kribbella sp. NBC_00382 TaxID=2975967 RepID=UPI002E1A3DC4
MLKSTLGYVTALWSLTYGVLGIYWATGGSGYPFARVDDDHATASILEGAPASVVAPVMVALGLLGAVVAVLMTRQEPRGGGQVLLGFAVVMAVLLALVIPD